MIGSEVSLLSPVQYLQIFLRLQSLLLPLVVYVAEENVRFPVIETGLDSRLVDSSTGTNRFANTMLAASPALLFPLAPLVFRDFLASVSLIASNVLSLTHPASASSSLARFCSPFLAQGKAKQGSPSPTAVRPCSLSLPSELPCLCICSEVNAALSAAGSHCCLLKLKQEDEPISASSLCSCCLGHRARFSFQHPGNQSWMVPWDISDAGITLAMGVFLPESSYS